MSDGAAPLTPSAPTSTSDIAASVIHEAEATDASSGDSGESSTRVDTTNAVAETAAPAPGVVQPTAKELSDAAKFLAKQGHKLKKDDGRDVWLPVKTVEGMLDRYVGEHRSTWDGERNTLSGQAKALQGHLDQLRASVAGDPKAFLSELAGIDPRYAAFLEQKAAEAPAPANDPEPQPDYDLGNGNFTYSVAGLAKREAWVRRQIERDILGKMDERFKPIAEREKAEKARADEARFQEQLHARSVSQMDEAQKWPLFGPLAADGSLSEFQSAVLTELKKDTDAAIARGWDKQDHRTKHLSPTLSLEGAYIRASSKRISEDENTKRARLLDEINKAPKSSALSRQSVDAPKAGPKSTADIARQVISRAEAAGA